MSKISSPEELGAFIRSCRKEEGITQEELTDLVFASKKFLVDLERGKETAQIGKIFTVMEGLGITMHLSTRKDEGL
ncbi:helix-turn-helix domain-containing protein [Desulfovibrio sp. JC010]|uniref:helix-turn-helix domain-containing protein n=1 Tax=Desulfovibrio sp. JC010 TaxID=2593641 RepID=UPI0013D01A42|nr:helix-turn-helix domain-containing protein [Desulfovibrio sp. JC010]NDV26292.1 helix-turn-helix transcriptional regulator [Desulfovibrio sp. JC010]